LHVVISRLLVPDKCGTLSALLTTVLILSALLFAVQTAVTRSVALTVEEPIALSQMVVQATPRRVGWHSRVG
jgi:hypothetical protein